MSKYSDDLVLALSLADRADEITSDRFRAVDLAVESKPDMTPVSEADRAVEKMVAERLATVRPGDQLLGEEYGQSGQTSTRQWHLDPIDGTKNYIRGNPVYATLIALFDDDEPAVGVVSAPKLQRRWWAAKGQGAYCNGEPIRVSKVKAMSDAFFCYGSLNWWKAAGRTENFETIKDVCWRHRGFGDFWMHMLVAEGAADFAIEPIDMNPWDLAALQIIITEAGGTHSDVAGNMSLTTGSLVTSNGLLHQDILRLVQ